MSDCKAFRREIEGAADGGAPGPSAAAHAEACAACGAELRARESLRGLVRGLGRVEAPPDFDFRLRARMAASKPGGGRGLFARFAPAGGLAWAAVAVCVLSVTAAVYFRQAQPSKGSAPNGGEVARVPETTARPAASDASRFEESKTQTVNDGAGVASAGTVPAAAQRGANVKRAAYQPRERESIARDSRNDSTQVGSLVEALRYAKVKLPLTNAGAAAASGVPAQEVQLGTSAGTLRVVLRDERGALVPMRSVSFGSQEPLSRQQAAGRSLDTKGEEGVW
jgi:hypothetical protein